MIEVTLKYGLTKSITREVQDGTTVRDLIQDPNNRALLGYPENVSAVIDGVTVSLDDVVVECDTVVFEKQAAAKAA